ncbi:MAG: glycosyltransferase family 2 protein [Phycisphaerales bacterium]|nr:glycosyltransferase family 2 protein [Phycisphaerales bacterium]
MGCQVSVCIICCNEKQVITTCLDSVAWCSDIVVVDSGSTDGTFEAAAAHPTTPRIIHQQWLGYAAQRDFAIQQCLNDWVLALDADEECSPQLAKQISALNETSNSDVAMFSMPRRNYIARRYVRCWSPDYQTRLLHKNRMTIAGNFVPEKRVAMPGFHIVKLTGPLLHNRLTAFQPSDFNDGPRMQEHAELLAQSLAGKGQKANLLNLIFRPALTFLKYYILRGGFLQGRFGLVIAYKTTIGVMLKYSVLYGKQEFEHATHRKPPE